MNVLLVIYRSDPARGGAERYTYDLATALAKRDHRVSLAASDADTVPLPTSVTPIKTPATGPTRTRQYASFLNNLDTHLAQTRYDITHAMLPVHHCTFYHPHAGIAAESIHTGHLKHDSPLIRSAAAIANRLNVKRQRFAAVERALLTGPTPPTTLTLSDYVAEKLHAHYPNAPAEKLFNAIDLEKFDPAKRPDAGIQLRRQLKIPANQTVVLMIAQDYARKGLKESLQALAQLRDPSLTLVVVGKQDPAPYQKLAQDLGITKNVLFPGPTKDPYAFYKSADLFVLPTRHDPCSLVVLEALAMGLPTISTRFNGATEIMQNGIHGTVLDDPQNIPALTQSLKHWLTPGPRTTASELCLQLRPKLSYETHLTRLEHLYARSLTSDL